MIQALKTFLFFLSNAYLERVRKIDRKFPRTILKEIVDLAHEYFPTYGIKHWRKLKDLVADFHDDYPFSITEDKLPRDLLGIYLPLEKANKRGAIILNTENSRGMHLSTVAHENGHLMTHLLMERKDPSNRMMLKPIMARTSELTMSLEDPVELLADYVAAMGAYPLESFKKNFCNKKGEVKGIYLKSTGVLYMRAIMYVATHYWELISNFMFCNNRTFQLLMTLHFVRLRVFVYQTYGM